LSIPEKDFDDLAGLDLKGKVVVLISVSIADSFGAGGAPSDAGNAGKLCARRERSGSFQSRILRPWMCPGPASL